MDTLLFAIVALLAVALFFAVIRTTARKDYTEAEMQERLLVEEKRVAEDTQRRMSATLKGQIGERFAPFVPGFGYEPADARFLGSPVDYVVFEGLSEGQIRNVAFVEVKTGHLPLTPFQRQVDEVVKQGRVHFRIVEL